MEFHAPFDSERIFEYKDDFLTANTSTTNIGELAWATTNTGSGSLAKLAAIASHWGVLNLTSGTTSGNNIRCHLGGAANSAIILPTDLSLFEWIVRVPTITTVGVRIGFATDTSITTPVAALQFLFDPAVSAEWQYSTRASSTGTPVNSGVTVVANTWYRLRATRIGTVGGSTTSWTFSVNNATPTVITADLPATQCNVGFLVQTNTTAARTLDVDWFRMRLYTTGRF